MDSTSIREESTVGVLRQSGDTILATKHRTGLNSDTLSEYANRCCLPQSLSRSSPKHLSLTRTGSPQPDTDHSTHFHILNKPVLQGCRIVVFATMFLFSASVLRSSGSWLLPASGHFDLCILPFDL